MKSEKPDPFKEYHSNFAKEHGISEEHLGVVVDSLWEGVRYFLSSPEMPTVKIKHMYTFSPSIMALYSGLRGIFGKYKRARKEDKQHWRDEYSRLNRIRKRRIIERFVRKITKHQI